MNESLLANYLIVGGLLFAMGMVGFMARRNLIVMFLSAEMMLQGVSLNLVAFNQYHWTRRDAGVGANLDGQVFALLVLTVAAAEVAIGLALVVVLFRREGTLDVSVWQWLREPGQPPVVEPPLPEPEPGERPVAWPSLPVAGLEPADEQGSGVGGQGVGMFSASRLRTPPSPSGGGRTASSLVPGATLSVGVPPDKGPLAVERAKEGRHA